MASEKSIAEIKQQLKKLLVENLSLEDRTEESIADDEVLFSEGLGLDSLDAVEIVVILQRTWGIEIKEMERGKEIFFSIDTLAKYIKEHAKKG